MQDSYVLEMRGIRKAFPGVQALDGVDLLVRPGEVMALVGENGAGKSTLMKILAGAYTADEGEIRIKGEPVKVTSPRLARQLGVAVIYQELNLAEHVSVAENIFIGREFQNRFGFVDYRTMNQRAKEWLDALHISKVDPRMEVCRLSIARKQMVEIAKALSLDASIIVMDEPTSSLPTATSSPIELNEVEVLLNLIQKLKEHGKAVIYISHRMNEIFRIADRITVMRDGRLVGVRDIVKTTPNEIIAMMVGRDLQDMYGTPGGRSFGEVALEVKDLCRVGVLHDISFRVRAGEILGVAGLVGAGRTEMARAIFGVDQKDEGEMRIAGILAQIQSPRDAIRAGLGYLPEDRKLQGLFLKMAVRPNITAASIDSIGRLGFIQRGQERDLTQGYIKQLNIRTPSIEQHAGNLSGGNQQKIVIAKWLAAHPKVLILDEPTRGVDVGAKMEIYALMREMATQGMAVIMISSELPEVLGMSDRIIVLREGSCMGELTREEATEEKVMTLATGVKVEVKV